MQTLPDRTSEWRTCWAAAVKDAVDRNNRRKGTGAEAQALQILSESAVAFTCGPCKPVESPLGRHGLPDAGGYVAEMTYDRRLEEALAGSGFTIRDVNGADFQMTGNLPSDPLWQFVGRSGRFLAIALDTGLHFRARGARDGSVGYLVLVPAERRVHVISNGAEWQAVSSDSAKLCSRLIRRLLDSAPDWVTAQDEEVPPPPADVSVFFREAFAEELGHYVWNCLGQLNRFGKLQGSHRVRRIYRDSSTPAYFSSSDEIALIDTGLGEKFEVISEKELGQRVDRELVLLCHGAQLNVDLSDGIKSIIPAPRLSATKKISVEVRVGNREMARQVKLYTAMLRRLKMWHPELQVVFDGVCPETTFRRFKSAEIELAGALVTQIKDALLDNDLFQKGDIVSVHGEPLKIQLSELQDCTLSINALGGGFVKNYWLLQNPCFFVSTRAYLQLHLDNEERFRSHPWIRDEQGIDRGWSFTGVYGRADTGRLAPVYVMSPEFCSDLSGIRTRFTVDKKAFIREVETAFHDALLWREGRQRLEGVERLQPTEC